MKRIILMFLVITIFIFGVSVQVQARMFSNNSPEAFEGEDPTSGEDTTGESIEVEKSYSIRELVIISAGHFLKGQRYINDLSEGIELSDIEKADFYSMRGDANNGLNSIYNAWYYYQELKSKAAQTPYNTAVIEKLASFDYDNFQIRNGLIKDVFNEVKSYLVKGDVRGVYSKISADLVNIYYLLDGVRYDLYWNTIPADREMWDLNQQCAKTLLFGQYVARVFGEIK